MEQKNESLTPSKKINDKNKNSEIKENIVEKPSSNGPKFNPNIKPENDNTTINNNLNNNIENNTNLGRYNDSNVNYTTNNKKDRHNSIIIDNKIIKNLNSSAFANNTANKRRNTKNISEGIRNMLKILKLDGENHEDNNINNINKDEIKNMKQKKVNINLNKNEKTTSDNNLDNGEKEIIKDN